MPKKAKKGGGGKGGGKTEEEKLMFLQQRAQAEEEVSRRKEEILSLFLKDKLQKEERNSAANLLKLTEGWRSLLRQTRAGELRGDLAVLQQTFERQLDGLDGVVKNVERDLREAERQSAQVRRVHLRHVERLWTEQAKRLALAQQQWDTALKRLSSWSSSERKLRSSHCQQQRADLEAAAFTVEQQHLTAMDEIHRLYHQTIAAYENALRDRKAALVLEDKDSLKLDAMQLCSQDTEELSRLMDANQRLLGRRDADLKRVKRLQDNIIHLRAELNSTETDNLSEEQDLIAARDRVNRKTQALRDQLTESHAAARKHLTKLTVQSAAAAKKLQAVIAKGHKVLRVAEMCLNLESEQRNVLSSLLPSEDQSPETAGPETERPGPEMVRPGPSETKRSGPETERPGPETERPGHETDKPGPSETKRPGQSMTEEPVKEISELQQVTRRISTCVMQRAALRKQRHDLRRENQQLRLLLRERLDAMTVSDHDLDGRHALLTVHRAPTASVPPDTSRRHTVIEGVHAVKHSL